MLLTGLFKVHWAYAAVGGLTVIFSAVYMLWMYQRVMLGNGEGSLVTARSGILARKRSSCWFRLLSWFSGSAFIPDRS